MITPTDEQERRAALAAAALGIPLPDVQALVGWVAFDMPRPSFISERIAARLEHGPLRVHAHRPGTP